MNKLKLSLAVAALAVGINGTASAASISNVASGSVSAVNTFNNIILDAANNRSNYLVFDLGALVSQLGGQAVGSATLTITSPGFYGSADDTETYSLWDFTGDVTALKNYKYPSPQPLNAVAVRDDLRSGISYGNVVISKPASGPMQSVTITLNANAIAGINNSLGLANHLFAIGGFSDTLTGNQVLFQTSGIAPNATLDVQPVPVPAAAWMFGSAVLGLGALGRKRRA